MKFKVLCVTVFTNNSLIFKYYNHFSCGSWVNLNLKNINKMNTTKHLFSLNRLLVLALSIMVTTSLLAQNKSIARMGSIATSSFDEGWLFSRFGLQPDGSKKEEPKDLEAESLNDATWQKLNLPHDWAIAGPFRADLTGETGKLPWKGIGWYRKHFTIPASDAGKQIFVDFDGAMAYAKIWLNGKYVGTWPYGYNSFRMDLTPFIKPGQENILAVRLDTESWDSRWYPGADLPSCVVGKNQCCTCWSLGNLYHNS